MRASGNATALTLNPAPSNPPSQATPPPGNPSLNQVAINFSNPGTATGAIHISFTPTNQTTSNNGNCNNGDVNPA